MKSDKDLYNDCKLKLVCKFFEELQFEEVLKFEARSQSLDNKSNDEKLYTLLGKNYQYLFKAKVSIWGQIWVNDKSLHISPKDKSSWDTSLGIEYLSISDFIKDINIAMKMDDVTLSNFIEEAHNTLYCDFNRAKKLQEYVTPQESLKELGFTQLEQLGSGHPKILLNKGRVGLNATELLNFLPETQNCFQLVWLKISRDLLISGTSHDFDRDLFLAENCLSQLESSNSEIIAVHPWQWERYIKVQFFHEIINGRVEYLGQCGPKYHPQSSLRTMSAENKTYEIKLSFSVLNTSCVRGIPAKYVQSGYKISDELARLIKNDSFLEGKIDILKELHSISFSEHPFKKLESSYRFQELLGMVVRESVQTKINESNEEVISTASLLIRINKKVYFKEILQAAKVDSKKWLSLYFEKVVIPLYYLQVKHGIGLVSHGQNVLLKLKNFLPDKLIIKDFHGDLRLSETSPHLKNKNFNMLSRLPAGHLIHDLYTGHFLTFLRYFSRLCEEEKIINEYDFYKILSSTLVRFEKEYIVPHDSSLLKESIEKVLINKVRFQFGYSELSRPLPLLGRNIKNPLHIFSINTQRPIEACDKNNCFIDEEIHYD